MAKLRTNVFDDSFELLDARLANPRGNAFAYPLPPVGAKRDWDARKEWVRRRILIASGLCPMPERTPLKARVYDRSQLEGCTVEKVHFESRPGFLVTGNLFRPCGAKKKRPAVLCPHGHWERGRMTPDHPERGSVLPRCIALARMGFVVFSYDMEGYNDSCQIEHRWPPEALRRTLLYGIGPFGLQLWNSIRAVDFLTGLPDVDPKRIGCTGASGGATQTYYLAAVDDRVRVVAPVCMMSSHYQGGCQCEEPPLLHMGDLTTLDVVGSLVPRPVLLPSVTQDWTNQNPTRDFPAVRRIYALYGAEDRIANVHRDAPHNYNRTTREYVYAWFRRWLAGDATAGRRVREPRLTVPPDEQLRLFPDRIPPKKLRTGAKLLEALTAREAKPFAAPPGSRAELRALSREWSGVYADVLGAREPQGPVSIGTHRPGGDGPGFSVDLRTIGRSGMGEQTPALWMVPKGAGKRSPAALVLCGKGKAELFRGNRPAPLLAALLKAGIRVLALDLLGQGETARLLAEEKLDRADPLFYAFNPSLAALRVQEVLTALKVMRSHDAVRAPALIGVGVGAVAALLARPLAGGLGCAVADLRGCRTESDRFWMGDMYHPFIRKLGGLRAALAIGPASPLLLSRAEPSLAKWARAVYRLQGKPKSLKVLPTPRPADLARFVSR